MKTIEQLTKDYIQLLAKAEETTSRRDAKYLINKADNVRREICNQHHASIYPAL